LLEGVSVDEVAFGVEMVVDVGVNTGELLQARHSSEPQHRSLSSSKAQMRVLDPVVGPAADLLLLRVAELGHGCLVGAQAVGGDRLG
jgi:hypothetical protein